TTVQRGTASSGSYPKALAGKTGTTDNKEAPNNANKDAWFVGYTLEYVTSMWLEYDYGLSAEDNYLTGGSTYPTQLTKKIITEIKNKSDLKRKLNKTKNEKTIKKPNKLTEETKLTGKLVFRGFQLIKGKLVWEPIEDKRIVYRVYEVLDDENELIAEVANEKEYIVDDLALFSE